MDIETVRQISLARHLYELGKSNLRSTNDLHLFAAVNLVQDAVESFLIAISHVVHADIDQNTKFDKYFIEINKKIAPKELPFKLALMRLNRIRVDSKHYGIQPARDECDRLVVSARAFFDETCASLLGVSFSTLSAIDLLQDGEAKDFLSAAKNFLEVGKNEECIIECRKAIFVEIESYYDVSLFKDASMGGLLRFSSRVPEHARNTAYIAKMVNQPSDFIVLDHNRIDQDLLKQGASPVDFWNLWRLTPNVYRFRETKEWSIQRDFDKFEEKTLADKTEYIFTTTIDLMLAIHSHRKNIKNREYSQYYIELASANTPIYEKADKNSQITMFTPAEVDRLITDYSIPGLDGKGCFYHISDYNSKNFFYGFVSADHIKQN